MAPPPAREWLGRALLGEPGFWWYPPRHGQSRFGLHDRARSANIASTGSVMRRFFVPFARAVSLAAVLSPVAAWADMRAVARVAVKDGVIHEGFAFDDGGGRLGYAETDGNGKVHLRVGVPGGKTVATDISSFTAAPDKILFLAGHWFVIANEGSRRAAVVAPNGRIKTEIGPFGDCFLSSARGKAFVTVTDRGDTPRGHGYDIAAYRPDGTALGRKQLTIAADGTLVGSDGLVFVAFTGGYLQALVKKPGRANAKADVRSGTEMAVLDVLTGKTGPGKNVPDIAALFLRREARREAWPRDVRARRRRCRQPRVGRAGRKTSAAGAAGQAVPLRNRVAAAADVGQPSVFLADRRSAESGSGGGPEEGRSRPSSIRSQCRRRQGDPAGSGPAG